VPLRVLVLLGSRNAFVLESDADREVWSIRGPFCETWPMNHRATLATHLPRNAEVHQRRLERTAPSGTKR
jgi:hypothetical protein